MDDGGPNSGILLIVLIVLVGIDIVLRISGKVRAALKARKEAQAAAEENILSNVSGIYADKIARDCLNKLGFGEYFTHSLGHGIGLEIHETPYLSKKSTDKLTDNMVFSVEPGVYFNGKFGIRIEDTVILQDGKVQRLFNDDKNLIIL